MTYPSRALLLFRDAALGVRRHEMLCFHELCNISVKSRCPLYRRRQRQCKGELTAVKHLRLLRASR